MQNQIQYEKFPTSQQLQSHLPHLTRGRNKSGREWKIGANKKNKNYKNLGYKFTWQQKKKINQEKQLLRKQIKLYKEKKIQKRNKIKQIRKIKKQQKQFNSIKSGKFEVIKNPKNIKKWSKKMKKQLVKLPPEIFQSIIRQ